MKILDKYIELVEKGYCSDCNELNCIGNFPQEKIVQEIKQLHQENQQLKKQKNDVVEYIKSAIENDDIEELKEGRHLLLWNEDLDKLLRMLGEEE